MYIIYNYYVIYLLCLVGGPRFCSRDFVQTATRNCRNGDMNEGEDVEEFIENDIMGQGELEYFNVSEDHAL